MDQTNEFIVPEELDDERFDAVIASLSEGHSRSYLKTLIKDGRRTSPLIFSMKTRTCWSSINPKEWSYIQRRATTREPLSTRSCTIAETVCPVSTAL